MNLGRFKWILAGCAVATSIIIASCGGSSGSGGATDRALTATAQILSRYAEIAELVYTDSLDDSQHLQNAIHNFLDNPTEDNLDLAKAAYKSMRVAYQQSEIMRWDTDITLGTNTGDSGIESVDSWEGQVNAWPLAEGLIDYVDGDNSPNIIASKSEITAEFLISQNGLNENDANVATGIHAIEFLLWGQDLNGTSAGAGERPASDYDLDNCSNENCDKRRTYLRVVTQMLVNDLTDMVSEWDADARKKEGTLAFNFLNSDKALSYIVGSMKVMADDELASARMGTALETFDPEEEHDCFSDLSHVSIYHNFQGIRNAFYGIYNGETGPSFADLVEQKSPSLRSNIDELFSGIEEKMLTLLEVGERAENPFKFDQVIGLGAGDLYYDTANSASLELIALGTEFNLARELLALEALNIGGGGDGD